MKVLLTRPVVLPTSDGVARFNDNGLGCITAACRAAGADVILTSWNVALDPSAFRRQLLESKPRIVGVKVFTTSFVETLVTLRMVRELLPDAITVIGGPHPSTSRPADLFEEFGGLLDFAVAGDGERAAAGLVRLARESGPRPSPDESARLPGLIYRDGGKVKSNRPCLDAELDAVSQQDWTIQQPGWFAGHACTGGSRTTALVCDSRGCHARCGHCMSWLINGAQPRKRSVGSVIEELNTLVREFGVGTVDFTGNGFLSDPDYVRAICDWIIRTELPLQWACTGAEFVENLRDPDLLQLMRRAGCELIHFGIESGNPAVVERLRKPFELSQCAEVVELAASVGIKPAGYFMFGFPDETVAQMRDTLEFAMGLPFDRRAFCVCLPLPGTSSYHAVLAREGIGRIDWTAYDFCRPRLLPSAASAAQVNGMVEKARGLQLSRIGRWKSLARRWKQALRQRYAARANRAAISRFV